MSLLSGLGGIVGGIGGFLTGGPAGAVAGYQAGTSLLGGLKPPGGAPPTPSLGPGFASGGAVPYGTGVNQGPFFGIPSAFGGPQQPNPAASGGQCPRGYHLNKHALAASKRHGALPARSICVRNRHLNPMNPRALSRALRREKRARKIVRKLHVFAPVRHMKAIGSGRKR